MYPEHSGYFAFPLSDEDSDLPDLAHWMDFSDRLEEAKRGNFERIPGLLDQYDGDDDWVRRGAYVQLMGDAGPESLLERVSRELAGDVPVDYEYDFAEMLFYWGRLDVVPALVKLYRENYPYQDAVYIPMRLSLLLEEEGGPLREVPLEPTPDIAAATCELALTHYATLCERYGAEAFVFRGRLLDAEYIARRALADLAEGGLDPQMKRKFETMTAIDCSGFYRERRLDPLGAAVVLEDFLAAPLKFEPGRRYFFGHRVPER